MRLGYEFSNIYGSVYSNGNIEFSKDGDFLLSPIGNRLRVYNLRNDTSFTLPLETRSDIKCVTLSPDQRLLWLVDVEGHGVLINYPKRVVLFKFNFKAQVNDISFSPDANYFAVNVGKRVQIWHTPKVNPELDEASITEYNPFVLYKEVGGHTDNITSMAWSEDSNFMTTSSRDGSALVHAVMEIEGYKPAAFRGHHGSCIAALFIDRDHVMTVDEKAFCYIWNRGRYMGTLSYDCPHIDLTTFNDDFIYGEAALAGGIGISVGLGNHSFHLFSKHNHSEITNLRSIKCTKAIYCPTRKIFCTAYNNGVFNIETLFAGKFSPLQTLTLNNEPITTCALNPVYEWAAFGTPKRAQLAVYEYVSETFIMVQQGHTSTTEVVKYSPNGSYAATASSDGKIKIWDNVTGLCVSTFNNHVAPVSDLTFIQSESVISASLDGTVRAFDLKRFQNFRTMKPDTGNVQFCSVTSDPAGEIIYAGTSDTFEVYAFSLRTGKELDVLAGHTGPVNSICFSPTEPILYTASWDGTVRTWELYASGGPSCDTIELGSPITTIVISPDGKILVVATSDSRLHWINVETGEIIYQLDIFRDVTGGRRNTDTRASKDSHYGKCFKTLAISPDGSVLLAGGDSNMMCFYSMENKTMVSNFKITHNRSVDGVLERLNSKNIMSTGFTADEIKLSLDDFIDENLLSIEESKSLPGAENAVDRTTVLEARCASLAFSPTSDCILAATSVGVLEYSKNNYTYFDPISFESSIVPELVDEKLEKSDFTKALCVALRLDDDALIEKVILSTPLIQAPFVCKDLSPEVYGVRFLKFLATMYSKTVHFYICTTWAKNYLLTHPEELKKNQYKRHIREVSKIADERTSVTKKQLSLVTGAMAFLNIMSDFKTKFELEAEDEAAGESEDEEEGESEEAEL